MNSKNITTRARLHMQRIKEMGCIVCDQPGPSEAHHIRQGLHYTCIALCPDCHRGPVLGWHGQKAAWRVRKLDEVALYASGRSTVIALVSRDGRLLKCPLHWPEPRYSIKLQRPATAPVTVPERRWLQE